MFTSKTARLIGGVASLVLGAVSLDIFPPLGLLEVFAAIVVLLTHHSGPVFLAFFTNALILSSALVVMVTVSGWANPFMWPMVVISVLAITALIRGRVIPMNLASQ